MSSSESSTTSEEDPMDHEPVPPPNLDATPGTVPLFALPSSMVVDEVAMLPSPEAAQSSPSQTPRSAETAVAQALASPPARLVQVNSANINDEPLPLRPERTQPSTVGMETDIDSESSMEDEALDEDDYDSDENFLGAMVEDISTPSKDELERMQRAEHASAVDHGRWEARICKPLDDPEYRPKALGRISWTLEGFHGTKEVPNRCRVMRSPAVEIGGYQWNIKVFPRGCEGTDHTSVFVECSGPASPQSSPNRKGSTPAPSADGVIEGHVPCQSQNGKWEVAAQIGCMMYNPEDPREYKFDQTTYQFQDSNQDCGWVRFHGPWTTLHTRRRDHWRPMLTKDRLAFTAYIRTIEDPTKALWWRQTENNRWNSVEKTGLRGLESNGVAKNAITAALAPWFHLIPFRKLLIETPSPSPQTSPHRQPWQLFIALQSAIYHKYQEDSSPVNLSSIEKLLDWYANKFSEATDVIEVWENIRSLLNEEYYRESEKRTWHQDLLNFVRTVRVKYDPEESEDNIALQPTKRQSAQGIIDEMSLDSQISYREWEGSSSSRNCLPEVLQMELPRQRYDPRKREWKRLTHKIRIDESVCVRNVRYRLFGLVVSKGKLGSGKVYSIVRSSHIGSQWARYRLGMVTYLTRRQAIESHEGHGGSREGPESVAHVLIYVRENAVRQVLSSEVMPNGAPLMPLIPLPSSLLLPSNCSEVATVLVHLSNSFHGFQGLGILDPYHLPREDQSSINFARDCTMEDVTNYLNETLLNKGSAQRFICAQIHWSLPPDNIFPRPKRNGPTKLMHMAGFPRVHVWARMDPETCTKSICKGDVRSDNPSQLQNCWHGRKELFFKLFDPCAPDGPSIMGLTSVFGPKQMLIGEAVGEVFHKNEYAVYLEQPTGFEIKRTDLTMDSSFGHERLEDMDILVLVPIKVTGPLSVVEYYQSLRNRQHWSYRQTSYRRAYFGGAFMHTELTNGLITGKGKRVATNGDSYQGMFRNGQIHGNGNMRYAQNGDVYKGSWVAGQRSGQGEMTYGKTGNVYVGEWRDGRRYGVGTMSFKQADEQLRQCHICYTNEIDALFYRCGHILACEGCAKQCTECPVCRRQIDAVVKIFDMRETGA